MFTKIISSTEIWGEREEEENEKKKISHQILTQKFPLKENSHKDQINIL